MATKLYKGQPPSQPGHPANVDSISTTSTSSTSHAASTAASSLPSTTSSDPPSLPSLIVFDLDYTLWPFWVDTHVTPPIKSAPSSDRDAAVDKLGDIYRFYPDVPGILSALRARDGLRVAIASRTCAPDLAREMLKLLHVPGSAGRGPGGVPVRRDSEMSVVSEASSSDQGKSGKKEKSRKALDFFDGGMEIYPGSKIRHMEQLSKRTGVPFGEMLFFDDESRNREVESLGVTMCLVPDGMSWAELDRGLGMWRKRRSGK